MGGSAGKNTGKIGKSARLDIGKEETALKKCGLVLGMTTQEKPKMFY